MSKKPVDRVMIFIDGSNLLRSWWQMYPGGDRYDMLKLRDELTGDRNLVRPCYYGSIHPLRKEKEMGFHSFLRRKGFKTEILPLKKREEGYREKGVDGALLTDLVSMAHKDVYDVAILVSGDQDHINGLKEIKSLGKRIEIAYFDSSDPLKPKLCKQLRKIADVFIDLDEIKDDIKK